MRNVPPTKTNLLRIRDELSFAELGHDLLDQKRNILVIELLSMMDQAADYQGQVDKAISEAYRDLEEAVLKMGKLKALSLASAINIESDVTIRQRKVMGVSLPVVEYWV